MAFEEKEIVVISPYISDFPMPLIDKRRVISEKSENSFFQTVSQLLKVGISFRVFTTEGYARKFLSEKERKTYNLTIKVCPEVHEKLFITSTLFYRGTANLTYSGLYKKIEDCYIGLYNLNSDPI